MLRRFQYLDEFAIDDYLGSLDQGIPEDEVRREESSKSGKAGLGVGPVNAKGELGSTSGVDRNLRQNAASKFETLFRFLHEQEPKELWDLDVLDEDTWECLNRGSLINLEVEVWIPAIGRALGAASNLSQLADVMQAFETEMNPETAEQMKALAQFALAGGNQSIFLPAIDARNKTYSFLCKLEKSSLRTSLDSLEGSRCLFGQIDSFIARNEKELAIDMAGLNMFNREQRRAMARDNDVWQEDAIVTGPGAIVDVVAFYK